MYEKGYQKHFLQYNVTQSNKTNYTVSLAKDILELKHCLESNNLKAFPLKKNREF